MSQKVRVRFAPSPTGPLHIGGVRTALFNYLFAKKYGGDFVLRIEDTDQNRYVEGAEQYIIDALNWCNIPFDEGPISTAPDSSRDSTGSEDGGYGPYRQSERKHLYKQYADRLIESGRAYYAFDTAEKLDFHRKDHEAKGKTFIYNWHNRLKLSNSLSLTAEEVTTKLQAGEDYVIRFKSPQGETLHLQDEIRGNMQIDTNVLDDKVLFKSDGMPTYHLANIVDDHLMQITHVIRGEEWLPSLALHQMLYDAFGWEAPKFAHLPLIMKPVGKGKLSKRDGDKMGFPVFPLQWEDAKTGDVSRGYREDGYFPEAVVNFLAFLGWNPGTEQEVFSLEQLVSDFDLARVNKAGAKFDPEKTKWFQHQYMQKADNSTLSDQFSSILNEKGIKTTISIEKVIDLLKERASFVSDFWELGSFFFEAPQSYDEKASKKAWKDNTSALMGELIEVIEGISDYSSESVTTTIKTWITNKEIGFGKVMMPLRLCLVGSLQGPDVFTIAGMIGKEESVARIRKAIARHS